MDPSSIGMAATLDYYRKLKTPFTLRIADGQINLSVADQNRNFTTGADAERWLTQQATPHAKGEGATHGG